ncbi:hypothetical protein TrispH2_006051 [Trichoplax sp. H2]|nr:hypothetical protein TrispH2_006051 [Trichoplax sp. H2]|eukprot:RDD41009.1 hypothetical protein TrispH2_006051 [Trichoplax sp. H2]
MMKCFAVELQANEYLGNKLVVERVRCECQLLGTVCRVRLVQTFINKGQAPIQTAYISCLRNDISICEFSSYNSSTRQYLSSRALEKNTFDRGFSWLHNDEQLIKKLEKVFDCSSFGQLFTAQTGSVNGGECIDVSLTYVTECRVKNNEIKFTPPKIVNNYCDEDPFHYDIDIDLLQPLRISNIVSPTHDIATKFYNGVTRIVVDYQQPKNCGQDILLQYEEEELPNSGHYPNVLLCANGGEESNNVSNKVAIMAVFPPLKPNNAMIARDLFIEWGNLNVKTQCPSPKHLLSAIHATNYTSIYALLDDDNFPDGDIYLKGYCNNEEVVIRPSYCVCTTLSLAEDAIHVMICNWLYREMDAMNNTDVDELYQLMTDNNVLSSVTKYVVEENNYQMCVANLQNIASNAVRQSIGQNMKENNMQQKKRKLTPTAGSSGKTKVSSIPSFDRASFENDDMIIEEEESEELEQEDVFKYKNGTEEITVQINNIENKAVESNTKARKRRPTPVPRYQQFSADYQRMTIIRMPSLSED